MSGIQLRVLPSFPAQVVGVSPIVVTRSGLTYTFTFSPPIGFYLGSATVATASRLRRAMQALGIYQTVNDYIMNNFSITSDTSLSWQYSPYHPLPGLVSAAVKLAVPYTDGQNTTLWLNAFNLTTD